MTLSQNVRICVICVFAEIGIDFACLFLRVALESILMFRAFLLLQVRILRYVILRLLVDWPGPDIN